MLERKQLVIVWIHDSLSDVGFTSVILDLASPGIIPGRFHSEIQKLVSKFSLSWTLAATEDERQFLIQLSSAKSLKDIEILAKGIPLVPIALWQSEVLFSQDHKETWYQMHVYCDLLDSVFLFDKNYNLKRSECHASTIKYLKKIHKINQKEKDVKVDFILFKRDLGDIFTCEDKAENISESLVQTDIAKGNALREKRLIYLKSIIPFPSQIKYIEVLSAQFHGLMLTIYGSKMTEYGNIIHYQKTKAEIPASPLGHLPQAAHYFLTVMSLQRNIAMNPKKLEILFDACLKDIVEYLKSSIGAVSSNLLYESLTTL